MRSYPVKENPIGSAVSEILRYKQTDRHRSTLYYRLAASSLASRGFAPRGLINLIFRILDLKRKSKKIFFFLGGGYFSFF